MFVEKYIMEKQKNNGSSFIHVVLYEISRDLSEQIKRRRTGMLIKLFFLAVVYIMLFFGFNGQNLTNTAPSTSTTKVQLASPTPTESQFTPSPTNEEESATTEPNETQIANDLVNLSKQLTTAEIEALNKIIQVPEYDDLELILQRINYTDRKNLISLIKKAQEYNVESYTQLAKITGDVLPSPFPEPVQLTQEEKNLVISQFLNKEGEFTDEKLLTKVVPKGKVNTANLGIFEFNGVIDDPKVGITIDMNEALFESVLLFTEELDDHDYCVIGVTDANGNRMVTMIEIFYYENSGDHSKYTIRCSHSRDIQYVETLEYTKEFDNKTDYLSYLNKYRNNVMIAQMSYRELNVDQYLTLEEQWQKTYNLETYNEQEKLAITKNIELGNSRATVCASLLRSLWKTKKVEYGAGYYSGYENNTPGINELMNMNIPNPSRIMSYESQVQNCV